MHSQLLLSSSIHVQADDGSGGAKLTREEGCAVDDG
jgi:hypothetical protein